MPIKLIPPRKNKDGSQFSPFYYGRGTHLGIFVDRSTGCIRAPLAKRVIKEWEREIERGRFGANKGQNFTDAAVAYKRAGGDERPVSKLIAHFKDKPLDEIDQQTIDAAALELFPEHSAATRNREVYSPVSAILKQAGRDFKIRRPKGSRGRELVGWLWPEQAERLLTEAMKLDAEFGILCLTMLATGLRLSEATLHFTIDNLRVAEANALIGHTKNGKPRSVRLPPILVAALASHPRGLGRPGERVFRFHPGGRLYAMLYKAADAAAVTLPEREAFHLFRHTYGAWMRRYGGADTKGLVGTGAWDSEQAASRYAHAINSEEAKRADLLPLPQIKVG